MKHLVTTKNRTFLSVALISAWVLLLLIGGCGYPLKVKPFFDGSLDGGFGSEARYTGETNFLDGPLLMELAATNVNETRYEVTGSASFQGTTYRVSGTEEASPRIEYLAPQAFLLAGFVELILFDSENPAYYLCGEVRYGTGGGLGPDREKPTAQLLLYETEQTSICQVGSPYIEENIPLGYVEFGL